VVLCSVLLKAKDVETQVGRTGLDHPLHMCLWRASLRREEEVGRDVG